MTESTTPLTSEEVSVPAAKVGSDKSTTEKPVSKKVASAKPVDNPPANKLSKLAIVALLVAIAAPSAHYYWQKLQDQKLTQALSKTLTDQINAENGVTLSRYQNQLQQALAKQQQSFNHQLQQLAEQVQSTSQAKMIELDANVAKLEQDIKQRQPSDWLLHEAEYLIRIAARTLWLEHDTSAAIGLLNDANARLTELQDPAFLSVREVIFQDIKSLELMPTLQTEEVVLTLMAMSKQVNQLTLAINVLGQKNEEETDLTLSDDINDWQTNLSKTWQKFFNDFIRVRPRSGTVEPLMSPLQQENLKQNLSLKIQLALWAASERKGDVYQKSLVDIEQWLTEFFDMSDNINQQFVNSLSDLAQKQVSYNYPSKLNSLTAIRTALNNQKNTKQLESKSEIESKKEEIKTSEAVVPAEQEIGKANNEDNK